MGQIFLQPSKSNIQNYKHEEYLNCLSSNWKIRRAMIPLRCILSFALLCKFGQIVCSDDTCCSDLRCWEKCFEEPKDPVWRNAFNQIYKIIDGIRGLYSPCSRPRGTCFSLDSTVHAKWFERCPNDGVRNKISSHHCIN